MKASSSFTSITPSTKKSFFSKLPNVTISRWKIFFSHLMISLGIFLTVLGFIFFSWFPGPLFQLDGGWQGLRLMAVIDLILGPSLTLLFYKPGRPSAFFDLSMIALVQLLALSWGVWAVFHQSTAALVFTEGRFVTLSYDAHQLANKELAASGIKTNWATQISPQNPPQIYAEPIAKDKYGKYLASVLNGQPELHERSQRYSALKDNLDAIKRYEVNLNELAKNDEKSAQKLEEYLATHKNSSADYVFYRLKARYGQAFVVIDTQQKIIIDII